MFGTLQRVSRLRRTKQTAKNFKYVLSHIYVQVMHMANMTLSIPDEVHKEMKEFSDVRWSDVARKAIVDRLETLKMVENIARKSKLTKKDVEEFSRKIKAAATKRFLEHEDNP